MPLFALVYTLLAALAIAEPAHPTAYSVTRRVFALVSEDGETTAPLANADARRELVGRGFTLDQVDPRTGRPCATRESTVTARPDGDALDYAETLLSLSDDGTTATAPLRSLRLPLSGDGRDRAANPLMALHPYAMIAPEFEFARDFPNIHLNHRGTPGGTYEHQTPTWIYRFRYDAETGHLSAIDQYSPATRKRHRRTEFRDWRDHPSGRTLPANVTSRTYVDGYTPLVELEFRRIGEGAEQ